MLYNSRHLFSYAVARESIMFFSSLDFSHDIQKAINKCGYREMTAIQELAIIPARRGKDILANAQTGTGKTAAFALPILQRMLDRSKPTVSKCPQCLILTPTRELAEQLATAISAYSQFTSLSVLALYGGVKLTGQQKKLQAGVDILVSTPGRLLEHVVKCNVQLSQIDYAVLDEADRMLDMGFIADVKTLLQGTPDNRQTLMFSATMNQPVRELAKALLNKPEMISAARQNATADTVEHVMYAIEEYRKPELFIELIEQQNWFKVLVFTSTKAQANTLKTELKLQKITSAVCHGDKSQGSRRRAIADFKIDKVQVLIATEVAARGLDIQGLEYVVNYNLPFLAEDYVHRIGRAGRAGQKGYAISFVSREEERALDNIERLIGGRIKRLKMQGFEVGSRETLIKNIAKKAPSPRKNKATQTKIKRQKNNKLKNKN